MNDGYEDGERQRNNSEEELRRLERKLDQMMGLMLRIAGARIGEVVGPAEGLSDNDDYDVDSLENARAVLPKMTTKQHVALQMVARGASNQDIADRMGVSINTAKVHVRTIAKKMGLHRRAQIGLTAGRWLDAIDDEMYRTMSGGLPVTWAKDYSEPDQWRSLYKED